MTQELKDLITATVKLIDTLAEAVKQEQDKLPESDPLPVDMLSGKVTITPKELAEAMSISQARARELVHIQGFPAIKNGNRYVILVQEFREWLKNNAGKVIGC